MTEKDMQEAQPYKVLAKGISTEVIARYYLTIEFSKMFKEIKPSLIENMVGSIRAEEIWELCEAISFTYKLNGVFHFLSQNNLAWNEEVWDAKEIVMTGMDSPTSKVMLSSSINGNFLKFTNYLKRYFVTHSEENDPEKLMQHRSKNKPIVFDKLILIYRDGKPHIVDGSHRLIEMFLNGATKVNAFVGYRINNNMQKKLRVGKSTVLYLSFVYKLSDPAGKLAVLSVIKTIIANTTDGKDAFKMYWVDNQYNPEIKEAGIKLLRELDSFGSYC